MSYTELLFALLLVVVGAGTAVVAVTISGIARRAETQAAELAQLRAQVTLGGHAQESVAGELRERLVVAQTQLEAVGGPQAGRPPGGGGAPARPRPPGAGGRGGAGPG